MSGKSLIKRSGFLWKTSSIHLWGLKNWEGTKTNGKQVLRCFIVLPLKFTKDIISSEGSVPTIHSKNLKGLLARILFPHIDTHGYLLHLSSPCIKDGLTHSVWYLPAFQFFGVSTMSACISNFAKISVLSFALCLCAFVRYGRGYSRPYLFVPASSW